MQPVAASSVRRVARTFGRVGPSFGVQSAYLADGGATYAPADAAPPSDPASPVEPCSYRAFTMDKPVDGLAYGWRQTLIGVVAIAVGAGTGALVWKNHRGRSAAIGGALGLVAASANAYREYGNWKTAGGAEHEPGACDGHTEPVGKAVAVVGNVTRKVGTVAGHASNFVNLYHAARSFVGR